jgi:hypothetical protein
MFAYVYANGLERDPALARRAREEYVPYMESVIAFFEKRSVEVVGREFPQVLLMHANRLNAETMPDLLAMLRRRGYRFVSLDEALQDAAYSLPEHYVGRNGFSWIHRWSQTKGMANRGEPDEPAWLREAYAGMNLGKWAVALAARAVGQSIANAEVLYALERQSGALDGINWIDARPAGMRDRAAIFG